jgi:Flp pilus assembly protein TadG
MINSTGISSKKTERGSTMVELTLSILVFIMILFATMEFGRAVSVYNILGGAVREGSRYAVVHGSASGSVATNDDIQAVVRRWAVSLDPNAVLVTTTWTPGKGPGSSVEVRAQYNLTALTGLIFGAGFTIGSSSKMVISQ